MADEVSFLPLGAIIQSFTVGGVNIVQGFPTQELYVSHNGPFFGETIGRVANRISNAKLASVNGGKSYALAANNGPNTLHGGVKGWGKRIWDGPKPVGIRSITGIEGDLQGGESVEFTLRSENGDEGFPGEVLAKVVYTTGKVNNGGKEVTVLGMEYEAELVSGAEETVINMTNHSYALRSLKLRSTQQRELTLISNKILQPNRRPLDRGHSSAALHPLIPPSRQRRHPDRRTHDIRQGSHKRAIHPRRTRTRHRRLFRRRPLRLAQLRPHRHTRPAARRFSQGAPSRLQNPPRGPQHGTRVPILHGKIHQRGRRG